MLRRHLRLQVLAALASHQDLLRACVQGSDEVRGGRIKRTPLFAASVNIST